MPWADHPILTTTIFITGRVYACVGKKQGLVTSEYTVLPPPLSLPLLSSYAHTIQQIPNQQNGIASIILSPPVFSIFTLATDLGMRTEKSGQHKT